MPPLPRPGSAADGCPARTDGRPTSTAQLGPEPRRSVGWEWVLRVGSCPSVGWEWVPRVGSCPVAPALSLGRGCLLGCVSRRGLVARVPGQARPQQESGWRAAAGCSAQRWVSSVSPPPSQTLPVETSATASPACRGSHPSAAASAVGQASGREPERGEDAAAPGGLSAGSGVFGSSGSAGDLQGAGRRADYGSGCSSRRWTGRQIRLPPCPKGLGDTSALRMLFSSFQTYLNRVLIINL